MPSRLTAAALGAAVLLGVTAAAYAATEQPGAPATVRFSTARGDAPAVRPGIHQTTAPTGKTQRYAAITRPKGGSVAVAIFGAVQASVTTADGKDTCSDSRTLTSDVTGYTFLYVDPAGSKRQSYQADDCASATQLILQIAAKDDSSGSSASSSSSPATGPLQFAVTAEPALSRAGSPAPKDQQNEIKAPSRTAGGVDQILSDRLFAPTTLPAGSQRVSLIPGKLAVARIRVGWGQRLAASIDAPRNGSNTAPPQSVNVAITTFSPQWAQAGTTGSQLLFKEQATEQTANTYTAPVNAANRVIDYDTAGDVGAGNAQWTTVAGWYYVTIRVTAFDEHQKLSATRIPARLNLSVVGSATDGPTYTGADGEPVAAPAGTELSQGGSSDSGSSTATVLRIAGSILVVAVAAGVVVLLLRRRA